MRGNLIIKKRSKGLNLLVFVYVCEKECLDAHIDHGMHCRAFSVASFVDTEEQGIHFSA